jgi:hypothetical protein
MNDRFGEMMPLVRTARLGAEQTSNPQARYVQFPLFFAVWTDHT